jgi:hypothetical protein
MWAAAAAECALEWGATPFRAAVPTHVCDSEIIFRAAALPSHQTVDEGSSIISLVSSPCLFLIVIIERAQLGTSAGV